MKSAGRRAEAGAAHQISDVIVTSRTQAFARCLPSTSGMATTRHTGEDFEAGRVHRQQADRIPEMEQTGDDTGAAQRLPRVAPIPLAAEGRERLPVAANHRQHGSPARSTRALKHALKLASTRMTSRPCCGSLSSIITTAAPQLLTNHRWVLLEKVTIMEE